MADFTRDDVARLAKLALIELSEAELDSFGPQLSVILDAVNKVQEADVADLKPMSHPSPIVNVFRPDEKRPSLTPEEALSGAPEAEQQRFLVPQILGDEQ